MAATANTIAFLAGFIASAIFGLIGNFFATTYYRYKDYQYKDHDKDDNQHLKDLQLEYIVWGIAAAIILCVAIALFFWAFSSKPPLSEATPINIVLPPIYGPISSLRA